MGGITVAVASLALAPLPGPGWVTFFTGLALLAGEILFVARLLDSIEAKIRKLALCLGEDAFRPDNSDTRHRVCIRISSPDIWRRMKRRDRLERRYLAEFRVCTPPPLFGEGSLQRAR